LGSKNVELRDRGPKSKKVNNLTQRQLLFVVEYLKDEKFNAVNAAREAGYKVPNSAAQKLMGNPTVLGLIGKKVKERCDRTEIEADRVLMELARIGFSNPKDMFSDEGVMLPIHEMPDDIAACISGFDVTTKTDSRTGETETTVKVKFWNKNNALELLSKHLGLIADRLQLGRSADEDSASLDKLLLALENERSVVDTAFIESKVK
jgi:phage terminase small subunit